MLNDGSVWVAGGVPNICELYRPVSALHKRVQLRSRGAKSGRWVVGDDPPAGLLRALAATLSTGGEPVLIRWEDPRSRQQRREQMDPDVRA